MKLDVSNPELYNPVYIPQLRNDSRFRHFFGSAGSGKSTFEAQQEIIESFDPVRRGRKTLCVRQVYNTLKDSVWAELKSIIDDWDIGHHFTTTKSPLSILNKTNDVEFIFRGLDDVEKLKSVKGVDRCWIEEATELKNRSSLDLINGRLRGYEQCQITLSYNPISEHHWLKRTFHDTKEADHTVLKTTYKDNVRMLEKDPHFAAQMESYKTTSPNYYRVYALGEWGVITEGLIYDPQPKTKDTFPQEEYREGEKTLTRDDVHFYGLDFGFSDPTALIAGHIQDALPRKRYIMKEVIYKRGLDAESMVDAFDRAGVRRDVVIIADNARPELISTLSKAGYRIRPCTKFAGSVVNGIDMMRKYELRTVVGSKNLIIEFSNYMKKEKDGLYFDEPEKNQVDHGLDAARYGLESTEGGSGVEMESVIW